MSLASERAPWCAAIIVLILLIDVVDWRTLATHGLWLLFRIMAFCALVLGAMYLCGVRADREKKRQEEKWKVELKKREERKLTAKEVEEERIKEAKWKKLLSEEEETEVFEKPEILVREPFLWELSPLERYRKERAENARRYEEWSASLRSSTASETKKAGKSKSMPRKKVVVPEMWQLQEDETSATAPEDTTSSTELSKEPADNGKALVPKDDQAVKPQAGSSVASSVSTNAAINPAPTPSGQQAAPPSTPPSQNEQSAQKQFSMFSQPYCYTTHVEIDKKYKYYVKCQQQGLPYTLPPECGRCGYKNEQQAIDEQLPAEIEVVKQALQMIFAKMNGVIEAKKDRKTGDVSESLLQNHVKTSELQTWAKEVQDAIHEILMWASRPAEEGTPRPHNTKKLSHGTVEYLELKGNNMNKLKELLQFAAGYANEVSGCGTDSCYYGAWDTVQKAIDFFSSWPGAQQKTQEDLEYEAYLQFGSETHKYCPTLMPIWERSDYGSWFVKSPADAAKLDAATPPYGRAQNRPAYVPVSGSFPNFSTTNFSTTNFSTTNFSVSGPPQAGQQPSRDNAPPTITHTPTPAPNPAVPTTPWSTAPQNGSSTNPQPSLQPASQPSQPPPPQHNPPTSSNQPGSSTGVPAPPPSLQSVCAAAGLHAAGNELTPKTALSARGKVDEWSDGWFQGNASTLGIMQSHFTGNNDFRTPGAWQTAVVNTELMASIRTMAQRLLWFQDWACRGVPGGPIDTKERIHDPTYINQSWGLKSKNFKAVYEILEQGQKHTADPMVQAAWSTVEWVRRDLHPLSPAKALW